VALEIGDSDRIGHKVRGEVEKILRCFAETTVERIVWEKLQAQGDLIDHFRLLEFQASLGQEAEAINTLLFLFGDDNCHLRSKAIVSLSLLGNASSRVVSGLVSLLNDDNQSEDSDVIFNALEALGCLGSASSDVVSSLVSLLENEDSFICSCAAEVLVRLGYDPQKEIDVLLHSLKSLNSKVRISAVELLAKLCHVHYTSAAISSLIPLLHDANFDVRIQTIVTLEEIGINSPLVVNNLDFLLDDKDPNIRFRAAAALCSYKAATPKIVTCLLSLLHDKDSSLRSRTVNVFGSLSITTPGILKSLISLLNDEDLIVCGSAAKALIESGDTSPSVVNVFRWLLFNDRNSTATICSISIEILVRLGDASPQMFNTLQYLLNDENSYVRLHVVQVLFLLGHVNLSIINILYSLLKNESQYIRDHTSDALFQLSKTSDIIFPKMCQWLEENAHDARIGSAIDCLWLILVE
jgi:HEAT repeat protein